MRGRRRDRAYLTLRHSGCVAGSDEDRTLARLRALRSDLIDPTIAVHHSRVVKRTGDGILIEFRSVVDAVRCAIGNWNRARCPNHRAFPVSNQLLI
jgi:class 3 adenylate cyclase